MSAPHSSFSEIEMLSYTCEAKGFTKIMYATFARLQDSGIFGDTQPVPRQGALINEI